MIYYMPPALIDAFGIDPACGSGGFLLTTPPSTMTNLIPNRDSQHGGMAAVGLISQDIKDIFRHTNNWRALDLGEREALDMVAHKIARILSGDDPHSREHWEDVAGYAQAAMRAQVKP